VTTRFAKIAEADHAKPLKSNDQISTVCSKLALNCRSWDDRTPNDRYQLKSNLARTEPSTHDGTSKWSKVNMQTSVGSSDGVKTVVIPELVEVVSATRHATWEMSVKTTS
jgi:hypothetical protein